MFQLFVALLFLCCCFAWYRYNWSNGVSQWDKPEDVKNLTDSQLGHRVMPATPKGGGKSDASGGKSGGDSGGEGDKAAELWKALKKRSNVVQQWFKAPLFPATTGGVQWYEYQDSRTSELFYHNETAAAFQWDVPEGWSPTPVDNTTTNNNQNKNKAKNHATQNSGNSGDKWQMVTTPLGRSLYYLNKETGDSQWDRPLDMEVASSGGTTNSGGVSAMKLASTPKARNKDAAAKLWYEHLVPVVVNTAASCCSCSACLCGFGIRTHITPTFHFFCLNGTQTVSSQVRIGTTFHSGASDWKLA